MYDYIAKYRVYFGQPGLGQNVMDFGNHTNPHSVDKDTAIRIEDSCDRKLCKLYPSFSGFRMVFAFDPLFAL
jgi:hypothetical protein